MAELWTFDPRGAAFERRGVGGPRKEVLFETIHFAWPQGAIDPDRSSWAPASGRFLAALADGRVRVWSVETGAGAAAWASGRRLPGAALSPDGRLAVISHEDEIEPSRHGVVVHDLELSVAHAGDLPGFSVEGRLGLEARLTLTIVTPP